MRTIQNIETPDMKRVVMFGLIGLGVIALVLLVAWYFSNSWIRVTTDAKDATITILQDEKVIKQEKAGSLFTSLKPGRYTVEVRSASSAATKFTDLKNGAIATVKLDEAKVKEIGNIAVRSSYSMTVSDDRLSYTTESSQGFHTVTANENVLAQTQYRFEAVDWLSPDFGAAIVTNVESAGMRTPEAGVISGSDFTTLTPPENTSRVLSDVGVSNDKDVVVVSGSTLYRKPAAENAFREFYEGDGIVDILTVKHGVVLFEQRREENEILYGQLVSVNQKGEKQGVVETRFAIDPANAPKASQSPDQKTIAILIAGHITLYDPELKNPVSLPQPNRVSDIAWRDDSTLLFASGNTLWTYSLEDKVARALVFDDKKRHINAIAISESGDDIVFSSIGTATSSVIQRVKLDGNNLGENSGEPGEAPDDVDIDANPSAKDDPLSVVLPHYVTLAMCRADYMNFGKRTVAIYKLNEKDQATMQANLEWCISEVKSYLDKQGIDYSDVEFRTIYTDSIT